MIRAAIIWIEKLFYFYFYFCLVEPEPEPKPAEASVLENGLYLHKTRGYRLLGSILGRSLVWPPNQNLSIARLVRLAANDDDTCSVAPREVATRASLGPSQSVELAWTPTLSTGCLLNWRPIVAVGDGLRRLGRDMSVCGVSLGL